MKNKINTLKNNLIFKIKLILKKMKIKRLCHGCLSFPVEEEHKEM